MDWNKSSRCRTDTPLCVEVCITEDAVLVRDSKLGDASPVLTFTHDEWRAFLAGANNAEFDVPALAVS